MGRDGNFSDSSGTEDGDSQAQTRQQSHANSQSLAGGKSLEARAHRSTSSISGITVIPEDAFGTENKHAQSLFPRSDFRPKASDDTFIAGEDSNSSRPSRCPLADISATANRTPTSAGIVSEFSTPAELSFGPQSLPFMLRKRELVNEGTPSKPTSTATVTDLSKDPIEPSTSTQFSGRQQLVLDHYSESHEIQRSSVNYGTHLHQSSVDHGNKPLSEKKFTSWRRDQIKKAKRPELILSSTPKPIPTLYGPLSLPYARNPSGVDATVADDSAYVSPVFGLRPASGGVSSMVGTESVRSISSATQSSDVQSFRSASGSSVLYSTGKRFQGTKLISEGNNSIDETCKAGPLVVRDTYQNIGIKTEKSILALGSKLAHDSISCKFDSTPPNSSSETAETTQEASDAYNRSVIFPNPQGKKRVVSDTELLEPKLGTSVIGPSKSHANLRQLVSLSPIPGSPADYQRKSEIIAIRNACKARVRSASMSSVGSTPTQSEEDYTSSYTTPIRIPAFLPVFFNPSSMTYEINVSPDKAIAQAPVPGHQTVYVKPDSSQFSKADVSDNWRHKSRSQVFRSRQSHQPSRALAQTPSIHPLHINAARHAGQIMTIDKLFEKFSPQAEKTPVLFKSPVIEEVSSSDSTSLAGSDLSPMPSKVIQHPDGKIHADKVNSGASDALKAANTPLKPHSDDVHVAPPASYLLKGTPGAGRLLKKSRQSGRK
ncbi:hypothetical protein C345_04923 [Cryptococcus neoformans A2-102-5]|nr:hypothetical protein C346_05033 [Cryptococcus neoformans var. grubii D17-1]OXG93739.1 hypothetical protein C345_04923 [Cryptococcus neoformans var. grubii A2-102-5]